MAMELNSVIKLQSGYAFLLLPPPSEDATCRRSPCRNRRLVARRVVSSAPAPEAATAPTQVAPPHPVKPSSPPLAAAAPRLLTSEEGSGEPSASELEPGFPRAFPRASSPCSCRPATPRTASVHQSPATSGLGNSGDANPIRTAARQIVWLAIWPPPSEAATCRRSPCRNRRLIARRVVPSAPAPEVATAPAQVAPPHPVKPSSPPLAAAAPRLLTLEEGSDEPSASELEPCFPRAFPHASSPCLCRPATPRTASARLCASVAGHQWLGQQRRRQPNPDSSPTDCVACDLGWL
ncbi:hypothetical protein Droror1_Dr00020894 [Drosera rotundifolia]